MTVTNPENRDDVRLLTAALAGDESAFIRMSERHRRELRVHCYRMLGSLDDAEDQVQETLLRAWRRRETYQGRSSLRAWLYGIATHACLDFLEKHRHRVLHREAGEANPAHVPWLQPMPDRLLEPAAPSDAEPEALVISRQNIELAFLVAVQFLPARQRAVLILADVLEWPVKPIAELLDTSVASVNSALQRARATLREQQTARGPEWPAGADPDEQQRLLLERYIEASERADVAAVARLLRDDVRFSMPCEPGTYVGRDTVVSSWVEGGYGSPEFRDFRCLLTWANRLPALASYVRGVGQSVYRPLALDVLCFEDGQIAEITTFGLQGLVERFDLPAEL